MHSYAYILLKIYVLYICVISCHDMQIINSVRCTDNIYLITSRIVSRHLHEDCCIAHMVRPRARNRPRYLCVSPPNAPHLTPISLVTYTHTRTHARTYTNHAPLKRHIPSPHTPYVLPRFCRAHAGPQARECVSGQTCKYGLRCECVVESAAQCCGVSYFSYTYI